MLSLQPQAIKVMKSYLEREITLRDFSGWIAGYDWNDRSPERSLDRHIVGLLELIATEVNEGGEEEQDLRLTVQAVLEALDPRGHHTTRFVARVPLGASINITWYSSTGGQTVEILAQVATAKSLELAELHSTESQPEVVGVEVGP